MHRSKMPKVGRQTTWSTTGSSIFSMEGRHCGWKTWSRDSTRRPMRPYDARKVMTKVEGPRQPMEAAAKFSHEGPELSTLEMAQVGKDDHGKCPAR